jgi:hypothetical protein
MNIPISEKPENEFSLSQYKQKIQDIGFIEYPQFIDGTEKCLKDFLNYDELSIELRIHITRMLICRCVGIDSGIYLPADVHWWIDNFISFQFVDLADFTRTEAIKEALRQVRSDDTFGKCIVGTAFLYIIIESYTKFFLGLNPLIDRFERDQTNIKKYREMQFNDALIRLRRSNKTISREICALDAFFRDKANNIGLDPGPFKFSFTIHRLILNRNMCLHGENNLMVSEGTFLALLYILYSYCHLLEHSIEMQTR